MADSNALISQEDLRPVLKFVGRNWYWLLFFPIIGYVIAYGYTRFLPNVFAAKSEILLKQTDSFDYQSNLNQSFGYYSIVQDVINQKRVIKSYNVISETLDRMGFTTSYYYNNGINSDEVAGLEHLFLNYDYSTATPAMGIVHTIKVLDNETFELSADYASGAYSKEFKFGQQYSEPFPFSISKRVSFTEDKVDEVRELQYEFLIYSKASLVRKFKNSLSLQNEDYTSILSLTVQDFRPDRAKLFLDILAEVYMENTLKTQIAVNENTTKHIETQLGKLSYILDSLETEITLYKDKNKILDLSKEQDELFNSITDLESQKRQLGLRISSLKGLEGFAQSEITNTYLPPIMLTNEDAILQAQVNKLFELKVQRVQMLSSSTEENTEIKNLDTLIKIVKENIQEYVKNNVSHLTDSEKNIVSEIRKIEQKLRKIPQSKQEILGIEREFKVNEGLYQYLLEKQASTVIARAAIIPQVSVIESARSIGVIGPNRSRTNFIGLGIGLILALFIGLIRLIFFDKIENLQEFKEVTKLPVVGSVPNYANIKEKPLAIEDDLRSNVSESLRALRANLQYILPSDDSVKRILTSSLHPGEGKTFLSSNLSSFIAHTGKKVVVLDFDMHKPKVHKVFNMTNRVGVSSYLIGKQGVEDIVQGSSIQNLDVITAGPIPPNASDLILNDKVEGLLLELENIYDYIFIDTPPLMLISDSLILMKSVDIGLFVFNTEKASKQGVQYLEGLLDQNGISKVSLILNNVKHKRWLYYYGKYSYKYSYKYGSYGYKYSYGNEPEKKGLFKKKKKN